MERSRNAHREGKDKEKKKRQANQRKGEMKEEMDGYTEKWKGANTCELKKGEIKGGKARDNEEMEIVRAHHYLSWLFTSSLKDKATFVGSEG